MKVKDITDVLEKWAPIEYAESFDNVGLLIGSYEQLISKIIITLDITESVLEEAIIKNCNLIITFHPIFFASIKKLVGNTKSEKIAIKAIKNNISIYSIHTNLDNIWTGTNDKICKKLELIKKKILIPKIGKLKKLVTYVPKKNAEVLRNILFKYGAGNIGNYEQCSYNFNGIGTFKGNQHTNPSLGKKNKLNFEEETCINMIFPSYKEIEIKKVLFDNHPYEEVAYEIINIQNHNQYIGLGMVGELTNSMLDIDFIKFLKKKMLIQRLRHSCLLGNNIKKIAVLSGSGRFALSYAKKEKVDLFLSSDMKYHDFFEADNRMIIVDIGHYECEQFTKELIYTFLKEKFPNFNIMQSEINTNPIYYN